MSINNVYDIWNVLNSVVKNINVSKRININFLMCGVICSLINEEDIAGCVKISLIHIFCEYINYNELILSIITKCENR